MKGAAETGKRKMEKESKGGRSSCDRDRQREDTHPTPSGDKRARGERGRKGLEKSRLLEAHGLGLFLRCVVTGLGWRWGERRQMLPLSGFHLQTMWSRREREVDGRTGAPSKGPARVPQPSPSWR